MCCKRYHIIFSTFSLKFKCKICVQKEVNHNFKNHILVMWPATNVLIKIWPTSRFLKSKSYNFRFHKNDVTWPLGANGLWWRFGGGEVFSRQEERGKSKTHIPILLSTRLKWCWPSTPLSVRANIASSVGGVTMGSRLAIMIIIIRTYYWNSSSFHCGPYTNMKILKSAKNKQTKMIKTSEKR